MRYGLMVFITIVLLTGCSKDDTPLEGCISEKLEVMNMQEYDDQEIDCQLFLWLYEFNGKQYFLLDTHCADIDASPVDCDGNELCIVGPDGACSEFFANAEKIGIVGIGN